MLKFKLKDGNEVHINKEALEERVLSAIVDKLDDARANHQGMYSAMKSAVSLVMTMGGLDIKPPKGVNALDYLIATYVSIGLETLEKEPLEVDGEILGKPCEEAEDLGETSRD